ncbi:MAG: DUF4405 domain-containing protein [Candidatus Thiodiazotropha sp.]|jgi:hypothetical protein
MSVLQTRSWSTPVTIGAGLFVAVSGVMMFWGVHDPVEQAHEWIGLLFAGVILLHILNHWPLFKRYFSQRRALGVMGLVLITVLGFIGASATREGGNPMMKLIHSIESSPLSEVAPLVDQDVATLVAGLQSAGYSVSSEDSSLGQIARDNGTEPRALFGLVFEGR